MAFQKSIAVENYGYNANYWRLTRYTVNGDGDLTVVFEAYRDQASRNEGKGPMPAVKTFYFESSGSRKPLNDLVEGLDLENINTVEDLYKNVLYTKIKGYALEEQAKIEDPNDSGDENLAYFHDAVDLI